MKRGLLLFTGLLLAAAAFWALSSRSGSEPGAAQPSLPAPKFTAAAPGLVEPKGRERQVGSEIIGTLRSVDMEENDTVKAGQVIAIVKNDDEKAMLAQAKAQLDSERAKLLEAGREYKREGVLQKARAASTAALDTARKNFQTAGAGVEMAEAVQQQAQATLDKTLIRSPIGGIVLKKFVVAGEAVTNQPPTPIAVIGDLSSLRVRAEVDELDVGKIHQGQRVEIKADAFPRIKAGGVVIRVDKRMGPRRIQTDRSRERVDSNVLQTLVKLDKGVSLPIGLRVDVYFLPKSGS